MMTRWKEVFVVCIKQHKADEYSRFEAIYLINDALNTFLIVILYFNFSLIKPKTSKTASIPYQIETNKVKQDCYLLRQDSTIYTFSNKIFCG